jgi:hypothetical protein
MTTKKIPGRTYVSLSFSCPPAMERAINRRAAELGLHSRSDYLRKLFEQDLANAGLYNKFSVAKAPPRITRGRRKKKEPVPKSESASHLP